MTEKDLNLEQEVDETTPEDGSENEEAEFDNLFEEEEAPEGESEADKIARLEKSITDMKKGVNKFFSEQGRKTKTEVKKVETPDSVKFSPVLKRLYEKENPEISEVWDELIKDTPEGQDPIEYYETKKGWQLEAKARYEAKKEDEVNKSKISVPSSGYKGSAISFENIDLENKDHVKYLNSKPELRAKYSKWFTSRG